MSEQYFALASCYDMLTPDISGAEWAEFYRGCFEKYSEIKVSDVLELACGTGRISLELASLGYSVTALDISEDMLAAARYKADKRDASILFLHQDMRSFELYGGVDAVVCPLDSVNYLLKTSDIEECFKTVRRYLQKGGVFVFDINTKYKFETDYAQNCYTFEANEGKRSVFLTWQNYYNEKSGICDFYLTLFESRGGEAWKRSDEIQRERAYSLSTIRKIIKKCGFSLKAEYSNTDFFSCDENSKRRHFVCVKN